MDRNEIIHEILSSKEFFARSTRTLEESDSKFSPQPSMMTVAQQVAHVAHTIDWFLDGAFGTQGFDLDFEAMAKENKNAGSLTAARTEFERAYAELLESVKNMSDSEWEEPLAEGPIMGGEPRQNIIPAIIEHTAHHRGALSVYTRLLGRIPPMPYADPPL